MIFCRQITENVSLFIFFPRLSLLVHLKRKKKRECLENYERNFGYETHTVQLLRAGADGYEHTTPILSLLLTD